MMEEDEVRVERMLCPDARKEYSLVEYQANSGRAFIVISEESSMDTRRIMFVSVIRSQLERVPFEPEESLPLPIISISVQKNGRLLIINCDTLQLHIECKSNIYECVQIL